LILEGIVIRIITKEKLVKIIEIENILTKQDVTDLQPSIYIVRFKSAENKITERIVVQ
jgi:hypothetical protein